MLQEAALRRFKEQHIALQQAAASPSSVSEPADAHPPTPSRPFAPAAPAAPESPSPVAVHAPPFKAALQSPSPAKRPAEDAAETNTATPRRRKRATDDGLVSTVNELIKVYKEDSERQAEAMEADIRLRGMEACFFFWSGFTREQNFFFF